MSEPCLIALVGEAYGEEEDRVKQPFVGASGQELTRILSDAGISRSECYLTNTFNLRPPGNDISHFFTTKALGDTSLPPLAPGKYLNPSLRGEITRLHEELQALSPNLVVALGNTPTWALLTQTPKISLQRGTIALSPLGLKVLPTYHPAAILRQWELRAILMADLMKAKRESASPTINRPRRELWLRPTVEDLSLFDEIHMSRCKHLAFDIETSHNQIDHIALSPHPHAAISIKFFSHEHHYSHEDEVQIWRWVKKHLEGPLPKVAQNGLYDIQYLRLYNIRVHPYAHDTMLLHHALQPELPKGLGFLASIYSDEAAWKMAHHAESNKRDE